ncbi:MAG: HoxN/HupN/NixA family nickel/cobalt transporter, partial [Mesorhizobium sp.]
AYGWAFVNPIRKLWYNMTITAASVVIAIFIGSIETLGLIAERLSLQGGVWSVVGIVNGDLTIFGYIVAGLFVLSWLISTLVYKLNGYDRAEAMTSP